MKRFVLTGSPGAGKTTILRQLERDGFAVVEEAATDLIALLQARGVAEPWTQPSFIDSIVDLQKKRQLCALSQAGEIQFYDRSPICTAALTTYLGYPISAILSAELERIQEEAVYERRVFFIKNLGFINSTEARRISFGEALRFEHIHEQTYRNFGYELVFIQPGSLLDRVAVIKASLEQG